MTLWITTTSEQRPLFPGPKGGRYTQVWLYCHFFQMMNNVVSLKIIFALAFLMRSVDLVFGTIAAFYRPLILHLSLLITFQGQFSKALSKTATIFLRKQLFFAIQSFLIDSPPDLIGNLIQSFLVFLLTFERKNNYL